VWVPEGCSIGALVVAASGELMAPPFAGVPKVRRHRGYELTGLYRCFPSGVNPYGKMAAGLVQFRGNPTPEWWNRRGGVAHTPRGETADVATLKRACISVAQGGYRLGTAPAWAVAAVVAVDVQPNDVWATVYALGPGDDPDGQRCGLVWCDSLPAPVGLGFQAVDTLLARTFERAGGGSIRVIGGPMDSGHRKEEVWAWGRRGGHRVVVRGLGGGTGRGNIESLIRWTSPEKLADGKTPRPGGVKVLQVNTHAWKQSAVSMLQNAGHAPSDDATAALGGALRLFLPEDTPAEWMAQVTSEQLVTVKRHGFVERHWQVKTGHTANHYFDDLVYFLAFCHAKGASTLRDTRAPGGGQAKPATRVVGNLLGERGANA
jgi:phage terminase large subunit GpA-like protein